MCQLKPLLVISIMEQQLSKAERNRIAVAKHRVKIGIEKDREVFKEYMKNFRKSIEIILILNKRN